MLEENKRRVEKAQRRLVLELQRKEEKQYCELKLIQRQKEEASQRTKLDDKSLSYVVLGISEESKAYGLYDIEAADENAAEENISSGSLAEASSPSSNKARNKRPPVWMRDYAIGEVFFCKEDDEAQPCLPLLNLQTL